VGELLERLRAESPTKHGPPCSVAEFIKAHPDLADDVAAAFADSSWTVPAIHRVMKSFGYCRGSWMVGNHRRGECSCGRTS
jgi:hypothetical protein